ncbi:MAG TPA: class I SAM-dependent methyltransferase [Albitalea sp.]|nr:class I SAM-dependent methyltransferase [Albitalea sp.]
MLARIQRSGFFGVDEIELISRTYRRHGTAPGTPWDALRHAHLRLPDWFKHDLDPLGPAYMEQQHRLWRLVSGVERSYEPEIDEKEAAWGDIDPIRTPGFYARRDALAIDSAADHVIATGMLLKHCGLRPGDWALEYGAGFAQGALALARMGVNVDTVDVSATFCDFVRRQAEFFKVPLTAHQGQFGLNPRQPQKYRLIWFYESFHHCLDFAHVVQQLHEHLEDGGRIILAGEPIVAREYEAVPYPWGIRLHSEVVAVVRQQHWFELGFSEAFLVELFANAGFIARRVECEPSLFGQIYMFERRPDEVQLCDLWMPAALADGWHGLEPDGRWTAGEARLPVDARPTIAAIELELSNRLWREQRVQIDYGTQQRTVMLGAGASATVRFEAVPSVGALVLRCSTQSPSWWQRVRAGDRRRLGVFVRRLRYLKPA